MSVARKRKNQGRFGFRFCHLGKRYEKYGWETRAEAREAEIQFRAELKKNPPLPPTALVNVVADYLVHSAKRRSEWRVDNLRYCIKKHILPYFGESKLITHIKPKEVEEFILQLKGSLRPKSVWHVITNLKSTLNYAVSQDLLRENPVNKAD